MPKRVSVSTEDLVGILDSLTLNINGCATTLRKEWSVYKSVNSFTQFRSLEAAFVSAYESVNTALDILRDEKGAR